MDYATQMTQLILQEEKTVLYRAQKGDEIDHHCPSCDSEKVVVKATYGDMMTVRCVSNSCAYEEATHRPRA